MSAPLARGGVVLTPREIGGMLHFGRDPGARDYIGLDTESELITDHEPVPRLVCLQWYDPREGRPFVVGYREAKRWFIELARRAVERDATIVGHNVAYDLAVICRQHPDLWPVVWRLLDLGLVEDTILTEKLDAIARGTFEGAIRFATLDGKRTKVGYNLADCMKVRLGVEVAKGEETWRKRYGELREVRVEDWPRDAYQYAADDPVHAYRLRVEQDRVEAATPACAPDAYVFADAPSQTRAAFALFLCRWSGVRTDRAVVPTLQRTQKQRAAEQEAALLSTQCLECGHLSPPPRVQQCEKCWGPVSDPVLRPGYTRPRAKTYQPPSREMAVIRARVVAAFTSLGLDVPRTDGGEVSTADDTLSQAAPFDPLLEGLQEWMSASKLGSFLSSLERGFDQPIHTEPNVIVSTGRTSWGSTNAEGVVDDATKINLQNIPKMPGIREAYVPPPGMVMFSIDYAQIELCALGFVCQRLVGYSRMLELINAGVDLHDTLAAQFIGIPYEEFSRRKESEPDLDIIRQLAKAGNFGFPGGMGVDKFILTARKADEKGVLRHLLVPATVKRLKDAWFAAFPELREYFRITNSLAKSGQMVQLTSGRIRGNLLFTSCSNSFFQGLAADGAKEALYLMQRLMWGDPTSPAYGGHVFAFIHDEFVGCVPADRAAEAVEACYNVAMNTMRVRLPGVLIKGSKCLMLRWRKKADAAFDDAGRLIPFEHGKKYRKLVAEGKAWEAA